MLLVYRNAELAELDECSRCLRDGFAFDEAALPRLVSLWRELLRTGSAEAGIIEDKLLPEGERIVWFCIKAFVTDAFIEHLYGDEARPLLAWQLLQRHERGEALPVLSGPEVRRANGPVGGGVNIITLNSGFPAWVWKNQAYFERILINMADFNFYFCAGFQTKESVMEMYDELAFEWARGVGLKVRQEFGALFGRPGWRDELPPLPEGVTPVLYGIAPDEAGSHTGKLFGMVTRYTPPIFYFADGERELLQRALLGETDEVAAAALHTTRNTVKKRWEAIYNRIEQVAPAVLAGTESAGGSGGDTAGRGREKKWRVLQYLRYHPEELRAAAQPTRPAPKLGARY